MENTEYEYIGLFLDVKELNNKIKRIERRVLDKPIVNPHVTFKYRPESIDKSLFGKMIEIKITGYGFNEENEGVKVDILSTDRVVMELFEQIPVPHITLSISENGKAVSTRYLEFEDIEPIYISGIFGGFTYDRELDVKEYNFR